MFTVRSMLVAQQAVGWTHLHVGLVLDAVQVLMESIKQECQEFLWYAVHRQTGIRQLAHVMCIAHTRH